MTAAVALKVQTTSFLEKTNSQEHILALNVIENKRLEENRLTRERAKILIKKARSNSIPASRNKQTQQQRLPETAFRLIETVDTRLEIVMAAKSIKSALANGETVLLATPEKTDCVIRKFALLGMDAKTLMKSGKLIIFRLRPDIAGNLSLATNYREVFGELFTLAERPIDRIVILKMDLLVNLESQHLAYASVSKFSQAADEMGCKFIAQYSRNQSKAHDRLDAACSSLVNAYYVLGHGQGRSKFHLQSKNMAS